MMRVLFFVLLTSAFCRCTPVTNNDEDSEQLPSSVCADSLAINFEKGEGDSQNCVYAVEKVTPILIYFTSTECPTCGKKGNRLFKKYLNKYADSISAMAIHYGFGDPLELNQSKELFNLLFPTHSPFYFLNLTSVMNENRKILAPDTVSANLDSIFIIVIDQAPIAATAASLERKGKNLKIHFGTQFYRDTVGVYRLAAYLVEDSVETEQVGMDHKVAHQKVLRKYITPATGISVKNGVVPANYLFKSEKRVAMEPGWKPEDLHVVTILWERTGNKSGDWLIINSSITP